MNGLLAKYILRDSYQNWCILCGFSLYSGAASDLLETLGQIPSLEVVSHHHLVNVLLNRSAICPSATS